MAKAQNEAAEKVILDVVLVHLLTCFDEVVGSSGVGASRCRIVGSG